MTIARDGDGHMKQMEYELIVHRLRRNGRQRKEGRIDLFPSG
jgi:hypothetical protein